MLNFAAEDSLWRFRTRTIPEPADERSFEVPKVDHRVGLVFIINGMDYPIDVSVEAPLVTAVERALVESRNTGRPPSEWEVRNTSGVLLETGRTIEDLGLKNGTRLFLSLRVGAGGTYQ
jgi:hypothetical protein